MLFVSLLLYVVAVDVVVVVTDDKLWQYHERKYVLRTSEALNTLFVWEINPHSTLNS